MISVPWGPPGVGKSTFATGMALDYARAGRRVVANFPIDFAPASLHKGDKLASAYCEVIPLRPTYQTFLDLGFGWKHEKDYGNEEKSGIILIDEAHSWIPSRNWRAEGRQEITDWLTEHRKYGWDCVFATIHPNMIDSQIREGCVEAFGRIRRSDRKKVMGFRLPRFHFCVMRNTLNEKGYKLETRAYRGTLEQRCFNSYSRFSGQTSTGNYCTLPATHTKYRYIPKRRSLTEILNGFFNVKNSVDLKPKHPLIDRIMKLPTEAQRMEFFRRFEQCGAFS